MKRIHVCSLLALAVIVGGLLTVPRLSAQEAPRPQKLPQAEDILDRWAREMGGQAAAQKIKTSVVHMTVSLGDMKGRLSLYHGGPGKAYTEFTIEGLGKKEGGVRGDVAWEKDSITGARILQGRERAKALRDADHSEELNWRKQYKRVRNLAEEKVGGRSAYKVELTSVEGE